MLGSSKHKRRKTGRNHSIFRHDNFIGCFSADKIKMPARKYFCFNIPVYKNMVEESSCRSPLAAQLIEVVHLLVVYFFFCHNLCHL